MPLPSLVRSMLSSAVLALAVSAPAYAGVSYNTHYSIVLGENTLGVTGIIKYEDTATGGGSSWPDSLGGGDGHTAQTIDQIFPTNEPRTSALLLGLSYDGHYDNERLTAPPADTPAHLVMFMRSSAASLVDGQDFDTVFGVAESAVISWMETVTLLGVDGAGQDAFDAASTELDNFAQALKSFTVNDSTASAWFDIPANQFVDPGDFSVVSFSDGALVGSGQVTQTQNVTTNVPEPLPLSLVGLGLLGIAWRRRAAAAR